MIAHIYSVYDTVAQVFNFPFPAHNTQFARRLFADAVQNPQSNISQHPLDYALFHLGSYDDSTALFAPLGAPLRVALGAEFMNKEQTQVAKDEALNLPSEV